ncbi:hypothetical protein [Saccharopolyspora sp. NPDC002376]
MIRFENVIKRCRDGTTAVESLDLTAPKGRGTDAQGSLQAAQQARVHAAAAGSKLVEVDGHHGAHHIVTPQPTPSRSPAATNSRTPSTPTCATSPTYAHS